MLAYICALRRHVGDRRTMELEVAWPLVAGLELLVPGPKHACVCVCVCVCVRVRVCVCVAQRTGCGGEYASNLLKSIVQMLDGVCTGLLRL